jgi:ubiquinone/menaquinone biosynthesis C-methylase UbiE
MTQDAYEYVGVVATTWDLLRGDTSGWPDRVLFRALIEEHGQPALDVGCATGRLLLDYLGQGLDVDGVDVSPEMLALCQEKADRLGLRPRLFRQEMQRLDLPRRYRTILVPSSTFQLVLAPGEAAEAMRRFFEHLLPGGVLAMPFMLIGTEEPPGDRVTSAWQHVAERTRPEDGALVRRWSRSTFDRTQQLEHTEDRYEILHDGVVTETQVRTRSPATRWYSQEQALDLYRAAGFVEVRALHRFTREPAAPDDTLFTALGTRP